MTFDVVEDKIFNMIIKFKHIIDCSSEHPSYPATNLLSHCNNTSWRCAKPGEMLASVTFQFAEPSVITGLDIANYRSCVVVVTASTSAKPDSWINVAQHQFMSNDEAFNCKFRDQVQLFTKRELNSEISNIKFDRIKITCMQSGNLRELFGLKFFIARTEVVIDLGIDILGRFKLKQKDEDTKKSELDSFKEKYLNMISNRKTKPDPKSELLKKIKENSMLADYKRQENERLKKKTSLEKLETAKADVPNILDKNVLTTDVAIANDTNLKNKQNENVKYTPFGDVVPSTTQKKDKNHYKNDNNTVESRKRSLTSEEKNEKKKVKKECPEDCEKSEDKACFKCGRLPRPTQNVSVAIIKKVKPKKFSQLFQDISFSLSGFINPQRDEIRRKALKMGARYIATPNTSNNLCTHLICAFKNTPKYEQLKHHSKIVSHAFIEDCHNKRKRYLRKHIVYIYIYIYLSC